jgi:branched-chain amino acid transport system ATP-binding protein
MSILELDGVSKAFAGLHAVDDVSIAVDEHEFLGIIGPNGAGKTTLFSLLSGEQPPTDGAVVFDGQDITGWPAHRIARTGLVRTFQLTRPFASMTVLENVTIASLQRHRSRAAARRHALEVLDRVQLGEQYAATSGSLSTAGLKRLELARALAMEPRVVLLDEVLDRVQLGEQYAATSGSLSTAGLKRLELARALAMEPRVVLLDEVLAGLVPAERVPMIELLRELHSEGLTVLFVEHIMAAVMALSERLMVMHEGSVLTEGTPREVVQDPRVVEAYLGEEPA